MSWLPRAAWLLAASTLAACAADYEPPKETGSATTPPTGEEAPICDGVQQPGEATVDAPFDLDGDGFFDGANPDCVDAWDAAQLDCDDGDAAVHPGATELCNGVDDDCDGSVDVGAVDASTWYADADSDGYGDPSETERACDWPVGATDQAGDCNDADAAVNPAATEVCNGVDDDCDTLVDAADADVDLSTAETWYTDLDGDGYGDPASPVKACDPPSGTVEDATDCDDEDPAVYPGATEVWYDGVDGDCDGGSDYDADGDGVDAEGYGGTDCDDTDASITEDCGPASVCLSYNDTASPGGASMGGPNLTLGMQFVAPSAMTVTAIEVYTGDASGLNTVGVWSHDAAANAPGAVLQDGSWTMSFTPSWQGADLTTPVALAAGTTYWVGWEPINGATASLADAGTDLVYRGSFDAGASWNGPYTGPWMLRVYCTP